MSHDYPRLELLKQQASELGLSRDQVREFGSLSRRATWESAIAFRRATSGKFDHWNEPETVDNVIHSEALDTRLLSILSFPQFIALLFAVVGFFALIVPVLRATPNPLPIKITIQIGAK
jgi:hypothetical protein